jgi:uncharacterized protein YoxC
MDTAAEVLVIIVSTVLAIFLIVLIIVLLQANKLIKQVKRVTERAENVADSMEAAASAIAQKAGDIKDDTEGQLDNLNDELKAMIKSTKVKTVAISSGARTEFNEAVVKAKDAQDKAAQVLKAAKAGEATDPDLNKAVKQARQAIKNLGKFFKN